MRTENHTAKKLGSAERFSHHPVPVLWLKSESSIGVDLDKYARKNNITSGLLSFVEREQEEDWEGLFSRFPESTQSSTGGVVITYSSGRGEDMMKYVRHITEVIANEPVEDGYTHPAEKLLEKALNEYGNAMVEWIQSFIYDYENRAMAAALLECVARIPYTEIRTWATPLAKMALQDRNVQIRDAAVCALEMWGDSNSLEVLSAHRENEPWLRDYIERVITEISRR